MLVVGDPPDLRRKSLVEPDLQFGASARQEKTYSSRQRQQQPRQATTLPQRRRSQPPTEPGYQGYKINDEEIEKAKPVVVLTSDKGITKVETDYSDLAHQASGFRARSLLPTLSERPPPTTEGYQSSAPGREAPRPWEPKMDVDGKTQVPESVFKAMEKLGHAARHRGQHVLAKSTRHRGRKTLIRHDCLPGRTNSTEYLNAASGWEQSAARLEPSRQPTKLTSSFDRRSSAQTTWRSVLGSAKDHMLRSY